MNTVSFPGLGLEFTLNRVAFTIPFFDRPVYWYGVIITSGLILAVYLCCRWGRRFGISEDNIIDMMFFAVPAALVAVRVYYVAFNLDLYRRADGSLDWGRILRYGDGGLAIYGAIISSAIVLLLFCRKKGLSFLAYADLGGSWPVHWPAHRPVGQLHECGGLRRDDGSALADVRPLHRGLHAGKRLCGPGGL